MSVLEQKHIEQELRRRIRGDVSFDLMSRGIYSTDASNYQIMPVGMVAPHDDQDVAEIIDLASRHGIPLLARGGGTSLAGQAVGIGLVVDFSKYMNRVLQLNVEERWVRVQPGLVRDELNAFLAKHGLQFAIDPATANRCNIGGMVGNNSSGTRSIIYGKTVDRTRALRVLLTNGEETTFAKWTPAEYELKARQNGRTGTIIREFKNIIEDNRTEIIDRYPKVMRRVAGYNLDEFVYTEDWNLAKLLVGSEGTLATTLEVELQLDPLPKATTLCVPHYKNLLDAIRAVPPILEYGPSAVEILDHTVVGPARQNLTTAKLCDFITGEPAAILIVEFEGEDADLLAEKARRTANDFLTKGGAFACPVLLDKAAQSRVWAVRKSGLGLMLGMKGSRKPTPFIEDAAVPVEVLPEYIEKIIQICRRHEIDVAMYAHASVGLIHVRPILDLREQDQIDKMKAIAQEAFDLVKDYGGAFSGEHGDGLVRGQFIEPFYGPKIYSAFRQVKQLFDPEGILNPGKIIDPPPMDQDLRYGTRYRSPNIPTYYHFDGDGFAAAVEMCTGVGACRKTIQGVMCPSYIATRDEEHSTRGRANALRLAMTGQLDGMGLTSPRLQEVLDLCLSCKGCKSECPSNVDLARLKSEVLQHYHDEHGTTLRERLVGKAPEMARTFSGWAAPLVNTIQSNRTVRKLIEKTIGIDSRRTLPAYSRQTFKQMLQSRIGKKDKSSRQVVLFDDTYMNYYQPEIGMSAVELLESCGYEVIIANAGCCQRPRISHGLLKEAREEGEKTLRKLDEYIQQKLPILVCEPSCASALTDDLPDLINDRFLAERIRKNIFMIDTFLFEEYEKGHISAELVTPMKEIAVHGHCHQKALYGTNAMNSLLKKATGVSVSEIECGCCGMAGSFGMEKEHYEISMKIGEDRLFPALRKLSADTTVVACGFSCRHQIADATGIKAYHWVQILRGREVTNP